MMQTSPGTRTMPMAMAIMITIAIPLRIRLSLTISTIISASPVSLPYRNADNFSRSPWPLRAHPSARRRRRPAAGRHPLCAHPVEHKNCLVCQRSMCYYNIHYYSHSFTPCSCCGFDHTSGIQHSWLFLVPTRRRHPGSELHGMEGSICKAKHTHRLGYKTL